METLSTFIDFFLHIDKHLVELVQTFGAWSYAILFLIIFCETGLVVTPILPGDSLLFAAGALAAQGGFHVHLLALLLVVAAIIGDAVNYHIGAYLGPKAFEMNSRIFKKKYLDRTHRFYEKYGGKTIIIARFVPIVRTFAPFLAGVGEMGYLQFLTYNAVGAVLWIGLLLYAGFFFSELPVVKNNFSLVIVAIIILSILPAVYELLLARKEIREERKQSASL